MTELIYGMFTHIGVSAFCMKDAKEIKEWYTMWTMTEEQYEEYKKWALKIIKKRTGYSPHLVGRSWSWFWLAYGLSVVSDKK